MIKWRIWYGDESTFSSDDGRPEKASRTGVIAVVQDNGNHGPLCIDGHDFYCLEPNGEWFPADHFGLWDYMVRVDGRPLVLFGKWVPTERYLAIVARARKDSLEG